MVEHVLTGVELQYLRITPVRFEDFKVRNRSIHFCTLRATLITRNTRMPSLL
jgi:hypothetical protein